MLPEKNMCHPRESGDPAASVCEPCESKNSRWTTTVLEIGFGGGEHLAAQAIRHPETNFIGCEPFINGIANLLDHIDRQKLANIRIFPDDARKLLEALPDTCLDRCFILYPDPWPKTRHAERRIINPTTLDLLARTLKPGAELRLATDVEPLANWMRQQIKAHPAFTIIHDSATPPTDWIATRYEQKGIKANRTPRYLIARRL
jgi:tRNA (guanine-N7-)-methyltransferase